MKTEITSGDLSGAWRLRSWLIHYDDGRDAGAPFGPRPDGLLLYHPDGWMSATVHRPGREPFPDGLSPRELDSERVAGAYWSYFHYAGTFHIEGDCVIHDVKHSLNPGMAGTRQVRRMTLEEPRLVLEGIEELAQGARRHELLWQRYDP